jgi:hypothetical protein
VVVASFPMVSRAAGNTPLRIQRLSTRALNAPGHWQGSGRMRPGRDVVPLLRSHLTPSGLRVADKYFAPAAINPTYDYAEDNATADTNPFAQDHSTTYENLGRVTGYYERADWNPAGGPVTFRYQGSIMFDDPTAKAAQQDNVTHQQAAFAGQVSTCQTSDSPPKTIPDCNYILTQDTQRTSYFSDYVWAIGSCLIETQAQFPQALDRPTGAQVEIVLSNITTAASTLAQQLCTGGGGPGPTATNTIPPPPATATPTIVPATATPTRTPAVTATATATAPATPTSTSTAPTGLEVALLDVRVEKNGAKADLTKPSLIVVKAGQKVLLSIYVEFEQGAAGAALTFSFKAKEGGTQVISKTSQASVPGTVPAEVRETIVAQLSKKGRYTFIGSVSGQGQSQHRSTSFTVADSAKRQCATIDGTRYCANP